MIELPYWHWYTVTDAVWIAEGHMLASIGLSSSR